jgi:hypothetical protein
LTKNDITQLPLLGLLVKHEPPKLTAMPLFLLFRRSCLALQKLSRMINMAAKKSIPILFIIILVAPLLTASANAQTISKPTTPEVTIKLADHSYDVAPITSYSTNPYNNKTTATTLPGYHVQNYTIDLTIKNQPFPATIDGNTSYLLYDVRTKGHYAQEWIENNPAVHNAVQSISKNTTISFPANYAVGDEVEFQVRAILAYGYNFSLCASFPVYSYDYINVALSDWSPTQTFTMPDTSNLAATQSPTPINSTFRSQPFDATPIIIAVIIVTALIGVGILFYKKHHNR